MPKADIRWMPWGPDAFEAARASGRPLLVLLSAFWAAGESASLRARLENGLAGLPAPDRFVFVEADADRAPDLRLRYSPGQVPSAFAISADGTLLARLTSLDPSRLRTVLAGVAAASVGLTSERAGLGTCAVPLVPPGEENLERGIETLEAFREAVQAALVRSTAPYLPVQARSSALHFLLGRAAQTGDEEGVAWVVDRLHELAHSPLYDAVEGGFFGKMEPSGPRTFKLLGQNAEWLILALRLSRNPGAAFAPSLARGILHYLQNRLLMPGGAFGHAQQDVPGYYRLTGEERRRVPSPEVDPTVYTAPNALAVRALCKGWRLLGEPAYLDQALRTYAFLTSSVILPGGDVAHAFDGTASGMGYIEDALEMGRAGLALYHSTLDPRYLDDVRLMAAKVAKDFKNPAGEGFLDLLPEAQPEGVPKRPVSDRALNAQAAAFLLLASAQLEEESWAAGARGALGALVDDPGDDLEALSLAGSALLVALSPMAVFEAITDGSREQRFQIMERLRQIGVSDAVVTHRCPAPREGMQRLPRLVGTCGNQRHEILV